LDDYFINKGAEMTGQTVFKTQFILITLLGSIIAVSALRGQSAQEIPRPTDPFATLSFADSTPSKHRLENRELIETLDMFRAYSQGANALPRYKDPIATRGSKGVALFRTAAPAVTLVVIGTENQIEGLGSGALVRADGYVLTNWHVIAGHNSAVIFLKPASSAEVKDAQAFAARVVFQDSASDLALLKLIRSSTSVLPSIPIADMSSVQVAEDVHIIGHPHGELWSYSTGVISQIRSDYQWKYSDGSRHHARVLQMQTAINPGNSGGPVLDDGGSIVGLVAMSEEGQNLDYAIAADVIQRFLQQAYAINTRGTNSQPDIAADHVSVATGSDSKRITRLTLGPITAYWVSTPNVSDAEVFIWDGKTKLIHGQHPNASGGFSEWSTETNMGTLIATSEGRVPQVFRK
jgi:S1-C subfamily serine protease